jgi:hypothetical protein
MKHWRVEEEAGIVRGLALEARIVFVENRGCFM